MIAAEELKFKLTNIADLIHNIIAETDDVPYNEFTKNEQLKERVFSQLQEIGQSANEISASLNEYEDEDKNKDILDNLSRFSNARFNQEAEIDLNSVWNIIQTEFREIEKELMTTAKKY